MQPSTPLRPAWATLNPTACRSPRSALLALLFTTVPEAQLLVDLQALPEAPSRMVFSSNLAFVLCLGTAD